MSLFIDPTPRQIKEAQRLGAAAIELHTGDYANARTAARKAEELKRLRAAARLSNKLGLATHAGHGLDYTNVKAIAKIKGLEELNIGYSIVTRSMWVGLERAVKEMLKLTG